MICEKCYKTILVETAICPYCNCIQQEPDILDFRLFVTLFCCIFIGLIIFGVYGGILGVVISFIINSINFNRKKKD